MRLIDATPILQEFLKIADMCEGKNPYENVKIKAYRRCFERIADAPTVDASPVVHGHNAREDSPSFFECSVCHWECWDTYTMDSEYIYCPHCGAKMDEVSE